MGNEKNTSEIWQRVTAEYVPLEDRVRLNGEQRGGEISGIWLTRRLLDRLVPALSDWVAQSTETATGKQQRTSAAAPAPESDAMARNSAINAMEQQASRWGGGPRHPPVPVERPRRIALASTVRLSRSKTAIRLLFQMAPDQTEGSVAITFSRPLMRQWLNILHDTYLKAQWPMDVWPDWVVEARRAPQTVVRH
jgi:hypothetical protein